MKAEYVTEALCFLVCLFMVFASSTTACPRGWFGPNCQFKCYCDRLICNNDGTCPATFTCLGGWFGPACQYTDIAYQLGVVAELTDGNDKTCVPASVDKSTALNLNESFIFTWMRVVVAKHQFINQIEAKFKSNSNFTVCRNRTYTVIDRITADMQCDIAEPIKEIVLSGDGVRYLCSVYVSGGRNVALRENTVQSSTYSEQSNSTFMLNITFTSSKAVDGRRSQNIYNGFSCSMTKDNSTKREYWEVIFSSPRHVHKYVIYGRNDSTDPNNRLSNISLQSVGEAGIVVFEYNDTSNESIPEVLTFIHPPRIVSRVNIRSNSYPRHLALCEVEIFGELICETGKYGLDCENTCSCPDNASCIGSTGRCPFGSVIVIPQNTTCDPGSFGDDCSLKCSGYCAKNSDGVNSCQEPSGACDEGCLNGYIEPTCTERCPIGTYGKDCKQVCGPKCLEAEDANSSSCHHASGVCLLGCLDEAFGPLCNSKVQTPLRHTEKGDKETSYLGLIICLFVGVMLLLPVLYCFRKKKPTSSHAGEIGRRKP